MTRFFAICCSDNITYEGKAERSDEEMIKGREGRKGRKEGREGGREGRREGGRNVESEHCESSFVSASPLTCVSAMSERCLAVSPLRERAGEEVCTKW